MAKKGFILCVCQGTCPSFAKMDIFGVLSDVRRKKIFDYVCLHPQLCVDDGEGFLEVLLSGGQTEKLYIAACDPQMQSKMFRDAFEAAGFDKANLVSDHRPGEVRRLQSLRRMLQE